MSGKSDLGYSAFATPRQRSTRVQWAKWLAGSTLTMVAACSAGGGSSGGDGGLFTTDPGVGANGGPGGVVVAKLELQAPAQARFVLRGTLPVPKGTFPRADGKLPFSIRNIDGNCVPTQVEMVSRYPVDSDGADVLEVLATVDRPAGAPVGQMLQYQVVENPHPRGKLPIKKTLLQMIATPASALLVAHDVFGHEYRVDLLTGMRAGVAGPNTQLLRQGSVAVQMRMYGTMLPTTSQLGAPSGALPHFFGVHSYATAWANQEALSLDLRVNNGPSGRDGSVNTDDPLGLVYFKDVELWIPVGWSAQCDVGDPCLGMPATQGGYTKVPLVKPDPTGKMHVMPPQAMFHRRIAISKPSAQAFARAMLDQEGLGFCRRGTSPDTGAELYSWWNDATARYFPQRHKLPDLSYLGQANIQGRLTWEFGVTKGHLENGTFTQYPYNSPDLGWAHPWGIDYGGMTGGSEIHLYDGLTTAEGASRNGYRHFELIHRMYCDRQPQVLFNKNGEHANVEEWTVQGPNFPFVPMTFFQKIIAGNNPFGYSNTPAFQRAYVVAQGKQPAYEAQLLAFAPIDFQHYTRFTRAPKVLAWLGNDAIAKDDLRMAADIFRLSYHQFFTTSNGGMVVSQLKPAIQFVNQYPHRGFGFGRGEAWGVDCSIAAYSLSDNAWRQRWTPWFKIVADTLIAGQDTCNGMIQSAINNKVLAGQFRGRQSIEQAITENMLWGLREGVFRDNDPARASALAESISASCYAMIGPMAWATSLHAPWSHLAVGPLDVNLAPYCGSVPAGGAGNGGDGFQTPSSFAYGYELTGDPTFLNKAQEMLGGPNLLNALKGQGFNNLENKAALIATLQ